ncbi:MAG: hypothetical protein J2P37_28520, partial [Ktedonobacteraceae bacterium]|nr:hypothetical protein [Ktedonobacteraceae bacterium]
VCSLTTGISPPSQHICIPTFYQHCIKKPLINATTYLFYCGFDKKKGWSFVSVMGEDKFSQGMMLVMGGGAKSRTETLHNPSHGL